MPKALKVHPGERVDLVDYVQGANVYTQESQKFLVEREIIDRRARIFDGFKVRIEDQTLNPGLITVFNGNAANRDGQLVNNEDSSNDSRSVTLLGTNTNFYVEFEYTDVSSDTDARYFWDPTVANPTPIPDGSEFLLNVATRISPDWRIVTPVSTTGFEQSSNPNSVRIPLCVLRTNGSNQITPGADNLGLVLVTPASVLESDVQAGVTSFRVVDARTMPVPPFSITLDFGGTSPESRTVTALDRDNGIVTVGAATSSSHQAGAIVRVVGTPLFASDRTDPNDPVTGTPIPLHPDLAQRMWQADEIRGSGLLQSKETFGARDDLNLRCLKDEVDFLSAQIREMKFGNPRSDVVSTAPPFSFNSRPRYFDSAGSIQGARSNTVSIGNGSTSFGDFNGSSDSTFIAAINALPASGGTLFVKSGTYTFFNTVVVGKSITVVGENFNSTTILNRAATGPAFSFTADASLENLTISLGLGGTSIAVDVAGSVTVTFNYCSIQMAVRLNGAVAGAIHARRTLFTNADAGIGIFISTGGGTLTLSRFDACSFTNLSGPVFASAINSLTVTNSFIFAVSGITTAAGTSTVNNVTIQNCDITVTASVVFTYGTQVFSNVRLLNNQIIALTLPAGFAVCWFTSTTALSAFTFSDNTVSVTAVSGTYVSPSAIVSTTANTAISDVVLSGNNVSFPSNPTGWALFYVTNAASTSSKSVLVTKNSVLRGNSLVRIGAAAVQMNGGAYVISENSHNNAASTQSAIGVEFYVIGSPQPNYVNICDNSFSNYTYNVTGGSRIGIDCTFDSTAIATQVNVENNLIYSLSTTISPSYVAGVNFGNIVTAAVGSLRVVGNKILLLGSQNADCVGISVSPATLSSRIDVDVSNNLISGVGQSTGTTPTNSYGIRLDTVVTGSVTGNYVYDVGTTVGDAACLLLNSCGVSSTDTSGIVVSKNKLFNAYTALATANSGLSILVTGTSTNLNIEGNLCSQFGSAAKANTCIYLSSCESTLVSNNTLVTGTNSTATIGGAYALEASGSFTNLRISSNVIDLFNTGWVTGILVSPDGVSSGITIDGNSIQERTVGALRVGISVTGGATGLSQTRGVAIRNNTLNGARTGVLSSLRVGIYMNDCTHSTISSNSVDWLYSGVASGAGISIQASSTLYSWHHISCVGNLVANDGNALTADLDLDSTDILSMLVISNVVGDFISPGVISPTLQPSNWLYGPNLVS